MRSLYLNSKKEYLKKLIWFIFICKYSRLWDVSAFNFDKITIFIANVLDQDLLLFHALRISRKLRVFTTSTYEWISRHFYLFLTRRKNGLKFPKDQSMFDCFSKLFNLKQRTQRPFDFHFQNRLWLEKKNLSENSAIQQTSILINKNRNFNNRTTVEIWHHVFSFAKYVYTSEYFLLTKKKTLYLHKMQVISLKNIALKYDIIISIINI